MALKQSPQLFPVHNPHQRNFPLNESQQILPPFNRHRYIILLRERGIQSEKSKDSARMTHQLTTKQPLQIRHRLFHFMISPHFIVTIAHLANEVQNFPRYINQRSGASPTVPNRQEVTLALLRRGKSSISGDQEQYHLIPNYLIPMLNQTL